MAKRYSPEAIETEIYQRWEATDAFAPSGSGDPYCIVIPPPNVTGRLHMGHAFQVTIMDALTRYHRMRGQNTLWQPGTDHAGIATQMVVERLLDAEGTSRTELGREAFVDRVWQWKERSGGRIGDQLRRLGASVDWSRDRFTMDEGLSVAVRESFVRLHEEGLIYRGQRLVNWDPVLHTALSDLEVLSEEEQGSLWHFRYPLADDPDRQLVVATTRPETMLGDTAVAVHPEDPRYADLVGREVRLPLVDRLIPIIADEYVDPEFGTGCVKITPAHDFNDYEVGQRHNLPMINIFTNDASLNEAVPVAFRGLDRLAARKQVVTQLQALDLVDKIDDHKLMVPRGDRSGAVVEPYLTDQWYVRAAPLAKPAIEAVEDGRLKFIPANWDKTYFEWMRNIQDWCISRQLWWGHRIPAWYDNAGNVYVARSEEEARQQHHLDASVELSQDEDVLDTWFSSALWPFSTLGWPDSTPELKTFYPTSVLVTGFDIIFFWVARMAMMGLKFMGEVPFHEVYIHGLVRDQEGQKMSKSKGNILDPIDLVDGIDLESLVQKRTESMMQPHLRSRVEKSTRKQFPDGIPSYGTDALRFTFASLATTGRDVRFDMGRIEGYRNFCNKLWNAAHFVLTNTADYKPGEEQLSVADRWIDSKLKQTAKQLDKHYAEYRLDLAAKVLYEFVWHEFCDWYLELSKPVLIDPDQSAATRRGTQGTLLRSLDGLLRLLHPLMPYITEALWLEVKPVLGLDGASIITQPLPAPGDGDPEAEQEVAWIQAFISGVRQIRGEMDIGFSQPLTVWLEEPSAEDLERLQRYRSYLTRLARLEAIEPLADKATAGCAAALVGELRLLVPLAGIKDLGAERDRLARAVAKIQQDLAKSQAKLGKASFVERAPAEVVAKELQRVADMTSQVTKLNEQIQRLTV
jgi:valyl-tRNA synthetase